MLDDKQMLIIPTLDDLELEPSDSPYCTTTTTLTFSRDSPNGGNFSHNKIHNIPASIHGGRRKFTRKFTSFLCLDNLRGYSSSSSSSPNSPSRNRDFPPRISTISSNFLQQRSNQLQGGPGTKRSFQRLRQTWDLALEIWNFHWRMIIASSLTVISSAGSLVAFPLHLETVTRDKGSDGFSACFVISTILVILFLLSSLGVKVVYWAGRRLDHVPGGGAGGDAEGGGSEEDEEYLEEEKDVAVFRPEISWKNILKIGFSVGLSVLTLCSSWEDHKVMCNFQDPLLGLVILFAVITHAVSKWRHFGFKRAFSLVAVVAGVFVSVNYMLVDEHRCRGYLYAHPPKDVWTWKVHLVWTLAFVIAIWLWTVAMFCLESAMPILQLKRQRPDDTTNAVKMTVLRVKPSDANPVSLSEHSTEVMDDDPQSGDFYPAQRSSNAAGHHARRLPLYHSPYSKISYITCFNCVLWLQLSTWFFIASLFWTEFIPGFGINKGDGESPSFFSVVASSFDKCFHDGCSWWLIISVFVFSQAFTYLVFLIRSSLIAICISSIGFPIIGLWWSFFQISQNVFVWMPAYSGELFCALLGLPLIFVGTLYMFKLDILNPNRIAVAV